MLASGCSQPEPWEREDPAEALRAFLGALALRQSDVAWEFLEEEDRAFLESRAASIAERSGGLVELEPHALLRTGHIIASSDEIASIRPEDGSSGDSVRMVVSLHEKIRPEDQRSFTLEMNRRDGRWTIDLPLDAPNPERPTPTESP